MQIDESLQRILSQNELVIERFYLRFLKQHANARKHFAAVDLKQQSLMLTMALMTVEAFSLPPSYFSAYCWQLR